MAQVKIYTKEGCPYCEASKQLFGEKGVEYEEVNVTKHPDELTKVVEQTGQMTVPQIFIGEEFIGGFDDLKALNEAGKLDSKLAA